MLDGSTPEAASPLPLKGATPAAGQSPIRGVRLEGQRVAQAQRIENATSALMPDSGSSSATSGCNSR